MTALVSKLMIALDPAILAVVLAYTYGHITRLMGSKYAVQIAMGCVVGAAAIFAMLSPINLADGVIIDMRSMIVGLAGAFFGLIGVAIAAGMAIATRIQIGGIGMDAGVTGILLSAGFGLAWAVWVRPLFKREVTAQIGLGLMISSHIASAALLPKAVAITFMTTLAPWMIMMNVVGAIVIGSLIGHERRGANATTALKSAATTDPLTALLNRRSLAKLFGAMKKPSCPESGTAMLCFDVDHFKRINDTNGHMSGDLVLIEIKRRISACLRPSDLFSRIGGDEFLIVLPDVKPNEAANIAERCRDVIGSNPVMCDDQTVDVTISMGANWMSGKPDFNASLAKTDAILYEAKSQGRNRVAYGFEMNNMTGTEASYRSAPA